MPELFLPYPQRSEHSHFESSDKAGKWGAKLLPQAAENRSGESAALLLERESWSVCGPAWACPVGSRVALLSAWATFSEHPRSHRAGVRPPVEP